MVSLQLSKWLILRSGYWLILITHNVFVEVCSSITNNLKKYLNITCRKNDVTLHKVDVASPNDYLKDLEAAEEKV